jgi:hypothetical protein
LLTLTKSVVVAVLYWFVRIRLLPKLFGYRIEVEREQLDDGTMINRLVKRSTDYTYAEVDQEDKEGAVDSEDE